MLFEDLKLPAPKQAKGKALSTAADVLDELAAEQATTDATPSRCGGRVRRRRHDAASSVFEVTLRAASR